MYLIRIKAEPCWVHHCNTPLLDRELVKCFIGWSSNARPVDLVLCSGHSYKVQKESFRSVVNGELRHSLNDKWVVLASTWMI